MTVVLPRAEAPPRVEGSRSDRPKLAEGVELLGEYEGSGYVDPHYLARRPSGAMVQLSQLLFLVAEASDGSRDLADIAAEVTPAYGKPVSEDNVRVLVDDRLRPLGVLAGADGNSPEVEPLDPLLSLRLRTSLVSERAVNRMTTVFRPLFLPPFIVVAVVGLIAFDAWLFFSHGLAQGMRETLTSPSLFLLVFGLVVTSAAFHELGHATACAYGGGRPGRMGAGVYLAFPAFYTDVTDAYRLDRKGRLRTDLGGVYFNALFVLGLAGAFALTGFEPLLLVAFLLQVEIIHQMLPFLRLDGYYVVSDIAGVPDLFRRIGPILRSALPWKRPDSAVTELKRWVRVLVTVWVMVVLPVLLFNLGMILFSMPRIIATAWDSAAHLIGSLSRDSGVMKAVDVLQLVFLALPIAGLAFTFASAARRAFREGWRWSADSAPRRGLVLAGAGAMVAVLALAWWPDARVTPYRPGEKGTLQEQVAAVRQVGSGAPLFRSPREAANSPLPPVGPAGTTSTGSTTDPIGEAGPDRWRLADRQPDEDDAFRWFRLAVPEWRH